MDDTTSESAAITLCAVSKSFPSQGRRSLAVSNVQFSVGKGQIVALVGRSGAGKSTILRLVSGLLTPDTGTIKILGQTTKQARQSKTIGFMPQSPALLAWKTVEENVALLSKVNRRAAAPSLDPRMALAAVGLRDVAGAYPRELSGGMRQRVSLARTMATRAPIFLLDEPFSALDEITRQEMQAHIRALRGSGDHTVVVVTHSLTEAVMLADRVLVLTGQPGSIACDYDSSALNATDAAGISNEVQVLRAYLHNDIRSPIRNDAV